MATTTLFAKTACAVALLTLTSACSWVSKDRRLLLNWMDESLTPSSTTGRWLASPVTLPAAIGAGLTDALVIHPVSQIDDAWGDTVELLWESDAQTGFRRAVLTPLAAVATPFVFAGDWLLRAVFDIDDRPSDEPEPEEPGETAEPKEAGR